MTDEAAARSDEPGASSGDFTRDLVRWSEALSAIARTGLGFTQSLYEKERFEEVLHVAADIKSAADESLEVRREQDHFVQEWMESIGEGVPGYVTPKVAIGAIALTRDGYITAHSSACIPPIEPPMTACQTSMPSASVRRTWALTMSRIVTTGKREP